MKVKEGSTPHDDERLWCYILLRPEPAEPWGRLRKNYR